MAQWSDIKWVFARWREDLPRLGGDPTSQTFELTLSNLVRETIQNSVDAGQLKGLTDVPVSVDFTLMQLECEQKRRYLDRLRWSELRQHIGALDPTQKPGLHERLGALEDPDQPLWLLNIEDRNCAGLTGTDEWGEGTNFTELVRNLLKSHKESEQAGGSIGVGKTILWKFSGISTVLFNSTVHDSPEDSPRFIGVSSLPYHEQGGEQFYGGGHFGIEAPLQHARDRTAAISLKGEDHGEFADLRIRRNGQSSGLTIQIVDFRPPSIEENGAELGDIAQDLLKEVALNWWPALSEDGTALGDVVVRVEDSDGAEVMCETVGEAHFADAGVQHFISCRKDLQAGRTVEQLETPGETASRIIPVEFGAPKQDGRSAKVESHAELGVRLAEEDAENRNRMAYFRSPGIVVNYQTNLSLSLSARPFHAVLLCGKAVTEPDESSDEFERFLRTAEPARHDNWAQFDQLRDQYRQPYRRPVETDLFGGAEDAINELVQSQTSGGRGPQMLARKFPIGKVGGGKSEAGFSFRNRRVWLDEDQGIWRFSARISVDEDVLSEVPEYRWTVAVKLHMLGDEGKSKKSYVTDLELADGDGDVYTEDGVGHIQIDGPRSEIDLEGSAASEDLPTASREAKVELDLIGTVYAEGGAG